MSISHLIPADRNLFTGFSTEYYLFSLSEDLLHSSIVSTHKFKFIAFTVNSDADRP